MDFDARLLLDTLYYIQLVSGLGALIILLLLANRHSPVFRWLAIFLFQSLLIDILATVFYEVRINPNYINHLFRLLAIWTITPFFYYAIGWQKVKTTFISLNIFYTIFFFTNLLYIQKFGGVNTYTQTFLALLMICFSILYFFKLIKELPAEQIHKLPLFWVVSGFFLAYAGKLVIYATSNYLVQILKDPNVITSAFHNVLSFINYALLAVGVWQNRRNELNRRALGH